MGGSGRPRRQRWRPCSATLCSVGLLVILITRKVWPMAAIAHRTASDIALRFADGTEQMLSEHRGRVVVLQVMSTRCTRCSQIVKLLNEWQQTPGIQPIGIAINAEAREMIHDFIARCSPAFPGALDDKHNICTLLGLARDQ